MLAFSDKLKKLRMEKELDQPSLGKLFSLSKQSISAYEKGKGMPNPDTIERMADYFCVSTDYLLDRTDNRYLLLEENAVYRTDGERELLESAKKLSPKQFDAVLNLINSFSDTNETDTHNEEIKFKGARVPPPGEDPITRIPYWYMRLKALREERGLTLEEAAEQMDHFMTPEILQSYEEGREMPDPSDQVLLGNFYDTNWFFIIGRVNVRRGYAGETTIAIDAAYNEDHPSEPLSYEKRKQMQELYKQYDLVYDLEDGNEGDKKED